MALHWLLALMILAVFCLGLLTHRELALLADLPLPPAAPPRTMLWHQWGGLSILLLSVLRLAWRLTHPPPPMPPHIVALTPPWLRKAQRWTLIALYTLFFAVPLLGWAGSAAHVLRPVHRAAAFALAAAVTLHLAVVLWHQFIARDGLMRRMWPGPGPG